MARLAPWLGVLAAVGAGLALGGCGFTPLLAAPGVNSGLAHINVTAPQGRTGYLIRQHLDDVFARDHTAPADYAMHLVLAEARIAEGLRTDNVATRYELVLTAEYTLTKLPEAEVVKKGRVRVEITYDSADQPYASIAEEQDAEDRAADQAAQRIRLELATWIATGKPASKNLPKVAPAPANTVSPTGLPGGS